MKNVLLTLALIVACAGSGELLAQATPTRPPAAKAAYFDVQKTQAATVREQDGSARLRVAAAVHVSDTLPR